ncbi:MAG: amidohydrolase [Brevibacillus sp.]|nr:amidohydrolase [Brevibacillus sp.]
MKSSIHDKLMPGEELSQQLYEIRSHLHQNPELSFQEYQTCTYIMSWLEKWGIPHRRFGETGVVVDLIGEAGEGRHIGVRADIDALPIEEKTQLPFASKQPGVMHACGHDGHTTILLGTLYQLFRLRREWKGRVRCIFQPGEEADGAAQQMIEQGVLENPRVDGMLALHLWPHLPFGSVGVRNGAITASCDDFRIEIEGKGGHSARPQHAVDAIAIGSQILQALSLLVTKGTNPVDPVVVHVGKIQGGTASNIVADRVVMEGTTRTVSRETRKKLRQQLISLVEGIVEAYGATVKITYNEGFPPVINDPLLTDCVKQCAAELLGDSAVYVLPEPSMGADDFGAFAEQVPSTYFRLGIQQADQLVYDLHHPQFQFHQDIIPIGVKVCTHTVLTWLEKGEKETC